MEENDAFPTQALCECCGEEIGTYRSDPFMEEIYGEIIEKYICDDCYDNLIMEI